MKKNNQKLMEAFDHIDSRFVSEAMEYYRAEPAPAKTLQRPKRIYRYAVAAAVLAACVMLLVLAIPTVNTIVDNQDLFTPVMAENSEENSGGTVEYDGTRGLLYRVREDGETAAFVGFGNCTEETVVIATTYNGLPVVEMIMGNYWDHRNSGDYVYMADHFTYGNEYVKHLVISDTVEVFDSTILRCCANLESVYIGAKISKMRFWLFDGTEFQKVVKLEVSPDNECFFSSGNCIIEKATKTLFRGCKTSVIPADGSVEVIGKFAFSNVTDIKTIAIPDCVTEIESDAFSESSIESIILPANLQTWGRSAFSGCQNLVSVDLNGYTIIPKHTFYSCQALKEVKGSENIVEIEENGFYFCKALDIITFGTSLKKIGEGAFYSGTSEIVYEGTMDQWKAIEKDIGWNEYTDIDYLVKKVICTDGELIPEYVPCRRS